MAAEHASLIGARIREARIAAHFTQNELAEKIPGKSDGTQVSKWERGEHRISDDTLKHIARVLKHDVAWFHQSAPDKTQTPDIFAAVPQDATQLDRMEAKLNALHGLIEQLVGAEVLRAAQQELDQASRPAAAAHPRRAA